MHKCPQGILPTVELMIAGTDDGASREWCYVVHGTIPLFSDLHKPAPHGAVELLDTSGEAPHPAKRGGESLPAAGLVLRSPASSPARFLQPCPTCWTAFAASTRCPAGIFEVLGASLVLRREEYKQKTAMNPYKYWVHSCFACSQI